MFKIPKEAVGRRIDIMIQNIPTVTLKVTAVTEDEIVGTYSDGEEWHINQSFVMAWTYPIRKEMTDEAKAKMLARRRANKESRDSSKQA